MVIDHDNIITNRWLFIIILTCCAAATDFLAKRLHLQRVVQVHCASFIVVKCYFKLIAALDTAPSAFTIVNGVSQVLVWPIASKRVTIGRSVLFESTNYNIETRMRPHAVKFRLPKCLCVCVDEGVQVRCTAPYSTRVAKMCPPRVAQREKKRKPRYWELNWTFTDCFSHMLP